MITASVNGQSLNLPLDFSFDLIRESQLTKHDNIKGDCIPSITFPDTERNRAVLFNPTLFELKRDGVKEFPNLELMSDGFEIIRGTLVLNNGLSGFARGSVGNISAQNVDKLITDYDLPLNQTFANKASYSPDVDDYCAPEFTNIDFYKDLTQTDSWKLETNPKEEFENTILQRYHRWRSYTVNHKSGGLLETPSSSQLIIYKQRTNSATPALVISPQLYLFGTLKKLLLSNGIHLLSNELGADIDLKKMVLYNNHSIVKLKPTLTVGDITVTWWFHDKIIANSYARFDQTVNTFNVTDLLPPVSIKNFILGIQNLINICIVFHDNGTASIIDREAVTEKAPVSIDNFFTGKWELGEKKNVVLEFAMQHDTNDALFGSYYTDLTEREKDFGTDVADMAALYAIANPVIGELRRVISKNQIYEYRTGTTLDENDIEIDIVGWFLSSIDFQNFKYNYQAGVDKDVEKIETTFSTFSNKGTGLAYQLGRCNLRKNEEAMFTPRVFFDINGVAKNNSTNYYLNWRGTNNLIEKRWKKWAKFWANREAATGYFRLPAYMLQNFNMNLPYSTRQGTFIIDKMVTRITHAGIGETKAEVFKI